MTAPSGASAPSGPGPGPGPGSSAAVESRSRLEERYRSVLRALPGSYRAQWEEDMVATFLAQHRTGDPEEDELVADLGRPDWLEVASVLMLAVRLRIPGIRAGLDHAGISTGGEAVRLVALTGLLLNVATFLAGFGSFEWALGRLPWLPRPPAEIATVPALSVWRMMWVPAGVGWTIAFVVLMLGYRRAAQIAAGLALVPSFFPVALATRDFFAGAHPYLISSWTGLLVDCVVVLALGAFHHTAPAPPRAPWLAALPLAVLATVGLQALTYATRAGGYATVFADWAGVCSVLVVIAVGVLLAVPAARRGPRAPHRIAALTVLVAIVFVVRVVTLVDCIAFAPDQWRLAALAFGLAEAVAVLAAGLPLVLAVRGAGPPRLSWGGTRG